MRQRNTIRSWFETTGEKLLVTGDLEVYVEHLKVSKFEENKEEELPVEMTLMVREECSLPCSYQTCTMYHERFTKVDCTVGSVVC